MYALNHIRDTAGVIMSFEGVYWKYRSQQALPPVASTYLMTSRHTKEYVLPGSTNVEELKNSMEILLCLLASKGKRAIVQCFAVPQI